jgi:peptidoglycan/LPS O-acetylase OafA/YrhL
MATVPSSKASAPSFIHLDMARGLAAFLVLLGHLRSFVFLSYDELNGHSPVDTVVWGITGFAHQAVIFFFVLSGFFITRSILCDDRMRGFSWPSYLIKRLSRLWIVLFPCLVLTLLWDRVGMSLDGMKFYTGQLYPLYNSGPNLETGGVHLELSTLLGNLFFLQTIVVPVFGTNGPLWSLSNEFWYYLMFPLLYISITRERRWLNRAVNIGLFIAICFFVGQYIVISGIIWLFGSIAYIIYDRGWLATQLKTPVALSVTMLALLLSLVASKGHYGTDLTKDFFIGIVTATFVLVLARFDGASRSYRKVARILADGSYTMYLVHFPFMSMLATVILHNQKFDASIAGYAIFVGLAIVTVIYCYGVYWLFERQTRLIPSYQVWSGLVDAWRQSKQFAVRRASGHALSIAGAEDELNKAIGTLCRPRMALLPIDVRGRRRPALRRGWQKYPGHPQHSRTRFDYCAMA